MHFLYFLVCILKDIGFHTCMVLLNCRSYFLTSRWSQYLMTVSRVFGGAKEKNLERSVWRLPWSIRRKSWSGDQSLTKEAVAYTSVLAWLTNTSTVPYWRQSLFPRRRNGSLLATTSFNRTQPLATLQSLWRRGCSRKGSTSWTVLGTPPTWTPLKNFGMPSRTKFTSREQSRTKSTSSKHSSLSGFTPRKSRICERGSS